jgi:VWFA-related protein
MDPAGGVVKLLYVAVLAAWLGVAGPNSQDSPSAPQPEITLRGGTDEVLLDFIVRDKHQRLVEDLRPEDVQIFEDGVRQTPRSFVFRGGRSAAAAPMGSTASNAAVPSISDPLRQINLVTLVFEAMSPLSRRTAVARAHEFLKAEAGPNTWMAVYSLRYQLSVQQTYTTDVALLNQAVDRAGTGAYEEFAKENLSIIQRINSLAATGLDARKTFQPLSYGSAAERGPQNDPALAKAEIKIQQLILKTLFRQEGTRSIDALHTLIREQSRLPGRKTILFFSEGLVIPPDQPETLDSVIAAANSGNVTFYTVDARGLGTVSNNRLAKDTAQSIQAAEQSLSGMGPGTQQEQASGQALTPTNQAAEAIYQTDLQANARRLAEGTGGFAMDNSNDLRGPLDRVMEDIRSHYEITYAPTSKSFDGHFRKLEVKLVRTGLKVQSRAGYYALPIVGGETIAPYELAALNAMNMEPAPRSFAYLSAVLRFGEDCRVVFAVPAKALAFTSDAAKKSFQIRISVLGLVKDEQGQIVAKVGKDLPFSGPLDKQASFAQGKVTLTLPLHLAPGRYQVQTAVIDRQADRASVKKSVLIIPAHVADSPYVSDLVWVRNVAAAPVPEPGDPLETAQGRITPELNATFTRKDSASFYFVAFAGAEPEAKITLARDGKALATVPLSNPQHDDSGAYRYAGTLPISELQPGQYEIVVTITHNGVKAGTHTLLEVR